MINEDIIKAQQTQIELLTQLCEIKDKSRQRYIEEIKALHIELSNVNKLLAEKTAVVI